MGRFYKTTDPQMIDFMYKLPENLYMNVIQTVDKDIADKEAATLALYDKLKLNALYKDEARRKEIVSGYEKRVDELSEKLMKNPLEFRKEEPNIRNLAREIHEDWTRGEAAAIQGNFAAREAYKKKYSEAVAKGEANAADFNAAMKYFDDNFSGTSYDKETSLYNQYITEDLAKFINIENIAETRGQGYIADVTEKLGAYKEGNYLYTSKDKTKFVTYNDIHEGVMTAMMNDKELADYYKQQIKFGVYSPDQVDKMISDAAHRVAVKYSFTEQEKGRASIQADPFALQADRYAREKDLHGFKESYKIIQNQATDRNNEQAKYNTFLGGKQVTVQNRQQLINGLKENANKPLLLLQNQLLKQYENQGGTDPNEAKKITDAVQKAMKGDFTDLKSIAPTYNLGVESGFGTGIEDIEKQWKTTNIQIENDNRLYNAIRQKKIKEIEAKDPSLKTDIARWEATLNAEMNAILQSPEYNQTTMSIYSTQGDYFDDPNIPVHKRAIFKAHLDAVGKNITTDYMGAKMYITDEKAQVIPESVNNILRQGMLQFKQIEQEGDKPGEVKFVYGGQEIIMRRGDTRLVPQEMPESLGTDSYQTSIIMTDPDPQSPTYGKPKKYNVYVPQDAFPMDPEVKEIVDSKRSDIMVDETIRKANIKFNNALNSNLIEPENARYRSEYADNVEYSPAEGGTWYFKDDNTGNVVMMKGKDGENTYRSIVRSKYGGGFSGQYNFSTGGYSTSKSEINYSSKTISE